MTQEVATRRVKILLRCPDLESGDGDVYTDRYELVYETPGIVYIVASVVRSKSKRTVKRREK